MKTHKVIRSVLASVALFVLSMPLYVLVLRVYAADFFIYALKSALVLTLLYVPYALMLSKERLFRLNRAVLVGILIASLTLPFCNVSSLSMDRLPVMHATQNYLIEIGVPVMTIDEADKPASVVAPSSGIFFNRGWFVEFGFILFCGMMGLIKHRVGEIWNMRKPIREGALWHEERDGIHIYCHADKVAPYSWLNNIVISEKDYRENGREILLHETGHVLYRHSYDILLLTLVQALQWWNPFVYMLGYNLRDVHEYQADDYVLCQGVSARGYQLLLINKAVDSSSYTFVNSFYKHSLTKNRITMMQKSNPSGWMRYKALYVIPVAAFALSAFATPKFTTSIEETISKATGSKVTLNQQNMQAIPAENQPTVESYLAVRMDSTKQSQVCTESSTPVKESADEKEEKEEFVPLPDVMPVYEGGMSALYGFIARHVRYPAEAMEEGMQGRVFVTYVVEADGSISHVKAVYPNTPDAEAVDAKPVTVVAYGNGQTDDNADAAEAAARRAKAQQALKDEAVRVVSMMPKWTPGQKDGQNVRTKCTLPVMFRLN